MKNIENLINDALNAHKTGNLELAYSKYQKAYKFASKHPKLLYFFGILQHQRNDHAQAEKLLDECSKIMPNDADVEYNLGTVRQALGKHKKAIKNYLTAINANPNMVLAYQNLGASYLQLDQLDQAIEAFTKGYALDPANDDILYNLVKTCSDLNEYDKAIELAAKVPPGSRHYPDALVVMAQCHYLKGDVQTAIDTLSKKIDSVNNSVLLYAKLGNIYFSENIYSEAEKHYRLAIQADPTHPHAYTSLSRLLFSEGRLQEAVACLEQGTQHCPEVDLIKSNMALINLASGNLTTGWSQYIYRTIDRQFSNKPPFPPLKKDLKGETVYLVPDQGLGDQLFFMRFIPLLEARGAKVKVCVVDKLEPALKHSEIASQLVTLRKVPLKGNIFELGDLPYLLECGEDEFPAPLPLKTSGQTPDVPANGLPLIGITWRGGLADSNSLYKEIQLDQFLKCLKNIDANWFVLQRNPKPQELEQVRSTLGKNVVDVSHLNDDLEAMLNLLDVLDDHIGVSNTNVHLRCSLGKTGKVLIPNPPDWRWLAKGDTSPWVPGYQTYRQTVTGSWEEALKQLSADLDRDYTK